MTFCGKCDRPPRLWQLIRKQGGGVSGDLFKICDRGPRIPRLVLQNGYQFRTKVANRPCQNLDFPEGRNLGEFGRTLAEREDLIGECS